jgi:hypothetical protein
MSEEAIVGSQREENSGDSNAGALEYSTGRSNQEMIGHFCEYNI